MSTTVGIVLLLAGLMITSVIMHARLRYGPHDDDNDADERDDLEQR
jgi:hypothetical protein